MAAIGCGFAPVIGRNLAAGGIVVEHECAAANAGRLRFDKSQDELGGDCRVDGAAAGKDNVARRLGRERVGRRHHEMFGNHGLARPNALIRHKKCDKTGKGENGWITHVKTPGSRAAGEAVIVECDGLAGKNSSEVGGFP